MTDELIAKLKSAIESETYVDRSEGEEYGYEIYVDYNDSLSNKSIKDICEAENPYWAFQELLGDWSVDYTVTYGLDELEKEIRKKFEKEGWEQEWEENQDEIIDWISEHCYFYYPEDHFNEEVKVNIMLDTGNANYDFTMDNVLNWYGNSGDGSFQRESSILWLARQQRKATKLRTACKKVHRGDGYYVDREKQPDKFVESVIQELENLSTAMATLTFLTKMSLFDYFNLREKMKESGYIIISKDTMCGLFDSWNGSGSVLEIELDKDVKIPTEMIWDACIEGTKQHGYDIDEVYGLISSAWHGEVKIA